MTTRTTSTIIKTSTDTTWTIETTWPPGPPPSGALQSPGLTVTPPAASTGLLGIPGTVKPPAILNFQLVSIEILNLRYQLMSRDDL